MKLGVGNLFGETYREFFGRFGDFWRLGILPMALCVGIFFFVNWWFGPAFFDTWPALLINVLYMAVLAPLFFTWTQAVIAGKKHPPFAAAVNYSKPKARYFAWLAVFQLVFLLLSVASVSFIFGAFQGGQAGGGSTLLDLIVTVLSVAALAVYFLLLWPLSKVAFVLPAIATGEDASIGRIWHMARGNGLRVMWAFILVLLAALLGATIIVVIILIILSTGLTRAEMEPAGNLVGTVLVAFLMVFFGILAATLWGVAYRKIRAAGTS